ncbi:MAG: hypothetical protein HY814_02480, partial [Candidatus Riflebacteria bacterium]|nr:hypothetical protein [Candidatus Riflebacteria bacterium]
MKVRLRFSPQADQQACRLNACACAVLAAAVSLGVTGCSAGVAFLRAAVDVLKNLGPLGIVAGAIAGAVGNIDGRVREVVDKAKERAKLPDRTGYPANPLRQARNSETLVCRCWILWVFPGQRT